MLGCAVHKQVQYFAATDQETGVTNYYRMTVIGTGGPGTDYHIQAGYFSAAAVDMLRGSMPKVPILDLPVEQLEVVDRLTTHFYAALIQEAKRAYNVTDAEAIFIASQGNLAANEKRLGTATVAVNGLDRQLKAEQEKAKKFEAEIEAARKAAEQTSQRAAEMQKELDKLQSDEAMTSKQLDTQFKETRQQAAGAKQGADAADQDAKRLEQVAKTASDAASQPNATDEEKAKAADAKRAADAARAEATRLRNEQKKKEEEAKNLAIQIVGETGTLEQIRNKIEEKKQSIRDAKGAAENENKKVEKFEKDLENAHEKERALESELELAKVDQQRYAAARDAAKEILTLLRKRAELEPFSKLKEPVKAFEEPDVLKLARVIWYGTLSRSDLASIGMLQSTDPFQFRKLVYWATAANIDLNQFASEIDGVVDNVTSIAMTYRTQHAQRKKAKESRRSSLQNIINGLPGIPKEQKDLMRGLLDVANPPIKEDLDKATESKAGDTP